MNTFGAEHTVLQVWGGKLQAGGKKSAHTLPCFLRTQACTAKTVGEPNPLHLQVFAHRPHTTWHQKLPLSIPLPPSSLATILVQEANSLSMEVVMTTLFIPSRGTVDGPFKSRCPLFRGSSHYRGIRTFQSHYPLFYLWFFCVIFVRMLASFSVTGMFFGLG